MRELLNRRIDAIWIDDDEQHYVAFDTDAGRLVYAAEGDCCSESWFYHIIGASELLGHTVQGVETVKDGDEAEDGLSRQEYDKVYCIKLRTERGDADIEFRNSSNGYYGGWLHFLRAEGLPDDVFDHARMVPVTADYIAQVYSG